MRKSKRCKAKRILTVGETVVFCIISFCLGAIIVAMYANALLNGIYQSMG